MKIFQWTRTYSSCTRIKVSDEEWDSMIKEIDQDEQPVTDAVMERSQGVTEIDYDPITNLGELLEVKVDESTGSDEYGPDFWSDDGEVKQELFDWS